MARPTRYVLAEGQQGWDAEVDSNFSMITQSPVPFYVASTVIGLGTDFPAEAYVDCIAIVDGKQYISNGTTWEAYYPVVANVANSVAITTAEMASDFNDLLASLQEAGIMASA